MKNGTMRDTRERERERERERDVHEKGEQRVLEEAEEVVEARKMGQPSESRLQGKGRIALQP